MFFFLLQLNSTKYNWSSFVVLGIETVSCHQCCYTNDINGHGLRLNIFNICKNHQTFFVVSAPWSIIFVWYLLHNYRGAFFCIMVKALWQPFLNLKLFTKEQNVFLPVPSKNWSLYVHTVDWFKCTENSLLGGNSWVAPWPENYQK